MADTKIDMALGKQKRSLLSRKFLGQSRLQMISSKKTVMAHEINVAEVVIMFNVVAETTNVAIVVVV